MKFSQAENLSCRRRRDGAVVRGSSPTRVPGSILICGLSSRAPGLSFLFMLLVLFSAPRGFSPGPPVFPSPQKPTFPSSNSIWNCQALYHEPVARVSAQALPVFDINCLTLIYIYIYLLIPITPRVYSKHILREICKQS